MFLQQLINGLTLGAVYALVALGYTMVYGILGLINFAHGEIYMIGAYLGIIFLGLFTVAGLTESHLFLSLILTFLLSAATCAGYGMTLERIAYRPLRHAHRLAPLISAIGMSIFLQNYVMLTQGSGDKVFPHILPTGPIAEAGLPISGIQLFILLASVVLMGTLHFFIRKTRLGKAMRATAQDKTMASLCGIPIDRVIMVTFAIGSILAAVAGVMVAMYYGVVHFFIGYVAGIKAFTAAVLGGIGNIPGAMVGGLLLGLVESLGAAYISSEFKDGFAFLILIFVLIFRPSGLLGEKVPERA
ncbi:branched-chain amino acid ABC transporter permease [Candidatus Manganitrophus noduliformans]|uniref:Branched-chain amino acid ABC transporter permease n=1 Tax=Candidatus Manganitrophus noduliformans TaxID=2606439 RepID=A0A7X6DM73_9BACT|nr:branched-chain amino acid ABC transporter permease [Candidatus Manganitrophus noduliformans]NKE69667.1 branched-chain amino acid ABC transporter permease [Candidatus Manganitrophus noduliformans]